MSLFGSLVGDFEDDPFFGSHMQSMQRINSMMNSMFADPFGLMGPPAIMDSHHHHPQNRMAQMQMMPFGFPAMQPLSMGRLFSDLGNMGQNPNCHSYTSSSIMTMTSSPDGRPQVYQESMSTMTAPGGVKETKKTVSDSRTGTRKMAIGHHIGDRAHILEREHNVHNGEQEEHQEFINLEEDDAETFNKEWETKTKHSMGAITAPSYRSQNPYSRAQHENKQLALPSTVPTRSAESTSTSTSSTSKAAAAPLESPQNLSTTNRKRERSPDPKNRSKSKRKSTQVSADD
ncbi:PREDICTED: myeloid leukemia factor isoform X2 [Ceratosolen solmsi marchali]|uniref:Myeloid leukemia factor isoform X2 n=1 Tax=Ceratosolen solmsi marchali TaxID=326594 RepID=A0AAJ6YPW9_9HYME|nr:PREDICTED: myeloid leukemia factor isoform X2 [Ceratosolen solmsi marchali]